MTNSQNLVKKAFSAAVATTTILWSVGLSAFLPTAASAASFGDLIKGTTLSTVYYYGSDGQRYAFPNEKTFFSWYKDFSSVKTISDSELASITLAGNIVYRPGSRWIKITSDNKVYAVSTSGKVRWIENEATAKGLGGDNWNTRIDDVPDVFFTDYTVGDSLTSPAAGYEGMLWSDGTSTYLVSGGKYSKVSDAAFAANGYNRGFVLSGSGFTKSGLNAGTEITSGMTNLTDAAQKVTTPTYAQTQNVTVGLSSQSPAASTLVGGQAIANVMALDFTNPTSSAVTVKSLKLSRTGVSADSTLANVYLFSGAVRLTDSATVSSGVLSWNDASGLFTIPAGSTVTVGVRSDIANVSGQTVGLKLNAAADVGFVGAFSATGSFPVMSATHTTATATMATVSFGNSTAPAADAEPSPAVDMTLWENTVTVGNNSNGAYLHSLRFRNTGSIAADDIGNFRLYVGGVQRGSTVAKQDANGYITFDLSASPLKLTTNSHNFKLMGDVTGGSTRTYSIALRTTADAVIVDADYQQPVLVQANNTTFTSRAAATQTVAAGDLTFSKRTDSPSGDVTKDATGVALARFDVKATGEPMKVESLNVFVEEDDDSADYSLRNGAVYLDGTQVGNTTAIVNDQEGYTTFNFGSSFVVYPGTPAVLEVRADIYDNNGSNDIGADDTIVVKIDNTSSSNVLRKTSGSYITRPGSDVTGNTLTVKVGALTLAKNTSYANQTITLPQTAYRIGSYTLTNSSTEDVNLTSFVVDLDNSTGEASGDFSNLFVKYGPLANMTTLATKATPSLVDAGNTFSVNYTLAKKATIYVDVYADVDPNASVDDIVSTLALTANAKDSGETLDKTALTGQTITVGSGTFSTAVDGSTPVAFLAAGKSAVTAAKFRLKATNETYTVQEVQVKVASAAVAGAIDHVELYDGTTLLGSGVFSQATNTAALITGISLTVPANNYKVLTAKLVFNEIGTGAGASQTNVTLTLDSVKYANSNGTPSTDTDDRAANVVRVTKAYPTVSAVDLNNASTKVFNSTAMDVYKFTVTANGGDIALKQFKLPVSWNDGTEDDALELESLKLFKNGTDITSSVVISDQSGNSVEGGSGLTEGDSAAVVLFSAEDAIASGETVTYTLRATPSNFGYQNTAATQGDSFSIYLAGDASANGATVKSLQTTSNVVALVDSAGDNDLAANFIWSDVSAAGHSDADYASGTADWTNGYLVLNLDLPSEGWSL